MSLLVRSAQTHDETAVIAIILAAMATYSRWSAGWTAPADVEERERARWANDDPRARWLVACQGEHVVGVSRWVGSEPAVFSLLMVDPESWGGGVGSALHDHALSEMDTDRVFSVRLRVAQANLRARRFYERNGWHATEAQAVSHAWLGLLMLEYVRPV